MAFSLLVASTEKGAEARNLVYGVLTRRLDPKPLEVTLLGSANPLVRTAESCCRLAAAGGAGVPTGEAYGDGRKLSLELQPCC